MVLSMLIDIYIMLLLCLLVITMMIIYQPVRSLYSLHDMERRTKLFHQASRSADYKTGCHCGCSGDKDDGDDEDDDDEEERPEMLRRYRSTN